jgi:hypothetical protein
LKKFVFVNKSGLPAYTATPAEDHFYTSGGEYGEYVCYEIAFEADEHEILARSYWVEGVRKEIPARPSDYHNWDLASEAWLPNLDAAREAQRQAWNAWRDRELVAGYLHNGHVFHSDDRFMAELQLILKGYERGHLTGTSAIRTRDNAVLQMSHTEIEGLLFLIGLHRQAIYAQSWAGKDALVALSTLKDIMIGGPSE